MLAVNLALEDAASKAIATSNMSKNMMRKSRNSNCALDETCEIPMKSRMIDLPRDAPSVACDHTLAALKTTGKMNQ